MNLKKSIILGFLTVLIIDSVIGLPISSHPLFISSNDPLNDITISLNDSWTIPLNFCIYSNQMAMDTDGNICVSGVNWNFTFIELIKISPLGDILWNLEFPLDSDYSEHFPIAVDSQNNIFLATTNYNMSEVYDYSDFKLLKINSSGDLQWQKECGTNVSEFVSAIAVNSEDDVYVVGTVQSSQSSFDYKLMMYKFNNSGFLEWYQKYEIQVDGEDIEYRIRDILIDSNDNIVLAGSIYCALEGDYYYTDRFSWLKFFNRSGSIIWDIYHEYETGKFNRLALDSNEHITTDFHNKIVKYDTIGNLIWSHSSERTIDDLTLDKNDSLYLVGVVYIPDDLYSEDIYIEKINNYSISQWSIIWGESDRDYCQGIHVDYSGNIYLLTNRYLVKNPIHNGKVLYRTILADFYIISLSVAGILSLTALFFILAAGKLKIKRAGRD